MQSVTNARALITGGGHGLGREIAQVFAAAGAQVIVTSRDPRGIDETLAAIRSQGQAATSFQMDVCDSASVLAVRDRVHAELGPIDILVNNAGIARPGPFLNISAEEHLATLETNLAGTIRVTHAFLPDLIASKRGCLVNIVSASALAPVPFGATYAASKWGLLGFSESLREELRILKASHVRVTAVCPSFIQTALASGVRLPKLLPMLGARYVAEQVLDAVRREREMVVLPWQLKFAPLAQAILPRSWFRAFNDWSGVNTSMLSLYRNQPATSEAPLKANP
jgi:all-trans-retinol dehydrogenase (NAD+)